MDFKYKFCENNNYLNGLCAPTLGKNIFKLIHIKGLGMMLACLLFIRTIWMIMSGGGGTDIAFVVYTLIVHGALFTPYFIFSILCANRRAVILTFKTFEFWLKIGYMYYYAILWAIYTRYRFMDGYADTLFLVQNMVSFFVALPLGIAWAGLFDAIKLKKTFKVAICFGASFFGFWLSFYWTFLVPEENDYVFHISWAKRNISLTGLMVDSLKINAIFLAKQAILSWRRDDQCVLIKVSPLIEWKCAYCTAQDTTHDK
eukprot:373022_1